MCGINGIYALEPLEERKIHIELMNKTLKHRGPDAFGVFNDDELSLGHQRLSILDTDEHANQPMYSLNGRYVMVFNGEIYNYQKIASKYQLDNLKTTGDSEVLLEAFAKVGVEVLQDLNGMFSFSIWDIQKKELFIARDRMGIKPLYYYQNDKGIAFSSSLKSLLNLPQVSKNIDSQSLLEYLRYQTVFAPNTLLKDVKVLKAGYYMILNNDGEFKYEKYWDVRENHQDLLDISYIEAKEITKTSLLESVERRMIADVPLGAFLSGGVDSSAVVAAMSQVSSQKVNTFNVSFDESDFSESKIAKIVAEKYQTNHHEILLNPNDLLQELPNALSFMDHPSTDGINSYVVSKAVKDAGITVALSGLGGDELFGGYPIFQQTIDLSHKRWILAFPKTLRKLAGNYLQKKNPGIASYKKSKVLLQDYFDLEDFYRISRKLYFDDELEKLYNGDLTTDSLYDIVKKGVGFEVSNGYHLGFVGRVSWAEMNTYMQNILLRDTDQMSMAHALEVRVPFLDHQLVEKVMGMNDQNKYPFPSKNLLIESVKDWLPKEVYDRDKMGFVLPWNNWLKNELRDFTLEALDYLANQTPYFDQKELQDLWKRFENNDVMMNWSKIWSLVSLSHFIKDNELH